MAGLVIANIVLTLDGRYTGPGGDHDMSVIGVHGVGEQARDELMAMTTAAAVVLGRKNYEGFGGYWPTVAGDETAEPRDRRFAQWLDEVDKYVVSRTLRQAPWRNSTIVDKAPGELIADLRDRYDGDIRVLSSVSLIRQLLNDDLVDRLELTLAPTVVGTGPSLFGEHVTASSSWRFTLVQPTDTGAVQLVVDRVRDDR